MLTPHRATPTLAVISLMLLAIAISGCSIPFIDSKPSVTITVPYKAPSPTPLSSPTPVPTPLTTWNGMFVKLHGNVSMDAGEHVYGTVKIYYMDEKYWEEHPLTYYDTSDGGAYSLDVMAKVPFKVEIGYMYVGQLPEVMNTRWLDDIYNMEEDTVIDFDIMTANITPKY